ncbi:hypothetical protein LEMLEM_LOCUS10604 [Lemmus lemmus]
MDYLGSHSGHSFLSADQLDNAKPMLTWRVLQHLFPL